MKVYKSKIMGLIYKNSVKAPTVLLFMEVIG